MFWYIWDTFGKFEKMRFWDVWSADADADGSPPDGLPQNTDETRTIFIAPASLRGKHPERYRFHRRRPGTNIMI